MTPPDTAPATPPQPPAGLRRAGPLLATVLAYVLCGKLAMLLALPPAWAAPLYPGAGIALAAALVYGRRGWLGVGLGALVVHALLTPRESPSPFVQWGMPVLMAAGAAAQAALGAALVRWRLPGPLTLAEPRQVASFCLLAGPLACMMSASVAVAALVAGGQLPAGVQLFTWWTWWAGDTLGVLIAAPIVLTLVGQPRADWVGRRVMVGLPLLATTALLALATQLVARWDEQRLHSVFERDAAAAAEALNSRLQRTLHALEAMRGLHIASDLVTASEMQRAAQPWLDASLPLQALGLAERVPRASQAAWEAQAGQQDGQPLRAFDRPLLGPPVHPPGEDLLAIRHIEPAAGNLGALGVNILSVPAARVAALRAIDTDLPAATEGFRLTQALTDQTGVVVYRALYRQDGGQASRGPWRGVVFATLRTDQAVSSAMADAPGYLRWCLQDQDPQAARRRLAGPADCLQWQDDHQARQPTHLHRIGFAGRQWLLVLRAPASEVPDTGHGNAWLFSSVGLLSVAMLAALLLTVTGRARRIELAVDERTADLQREVQERQRTESALRESEQRFRNIFDHAPIGIAYADLQGRLRDANPRLRALLGLDEGPLAPDALARRMPADERAGEAHVLARLVGGELTEVRRRTRLHHPGGQLLSVQMHWRVLRNQAGEPQRLVAVVEDITDQLARQEAEQGRQVAESANRAKNEFLSRMSHELRTPLNAMLGFGQLLELDRAPPLAPHQAGWTAHILRAGWHLLEMINDTLDLSRIESGVLRLAPAPVLLPPLLGDCLAMVRPLAAPQQVQLSLLLDPAANTAWADPTRLKQVLINLLSNAVKYNVPGGRVTLSTHATGSGTLQIHVHDTGLGLSEAQMAELFQPFNRLGREQGAVEGTGIGLVISRRLAELMGGRLEAHSTEGQGATFVLTLPVAAPQHGGPGPGRPAGVDGGPPQRLSQVLYIEDNETNAEVMRGMLAQRPQLQMVLAATGQAGLDAVRRQPPDLVLLDMHLPDIDGLALLRQLKHEPASRHIPVLVVSADATPTRVDQALAAGALHYLTKPLNLGAFLSLIDQVLEEIDSRHGGLDG